MCAASHVRLRERGRLDGYAQIIAHHRRERGGNGDNSGLERRAGRTEKVTTRRKMDREAKRGQKEGEIKGMESN